MPDHCCVPACKSNYPSKDKTGYVSVFKFPKNEMRKKLWLRKIPRADFTPTKNSVVCEKHFRNDMVLWEEDFTDSQGIIHKIKRKRPILTDDAYPCIFDGCPSYLSEKDTLKRSRRDERRDKMNSELLAEFLVSDKISSFEKFAAEFLVKMANFLKKDNLLVYQAGDKFYVIFMNYDPSPEVLKSIVIDNHMNLRVYVKNELLDTVKHLSHILDNCTKLSLWSEIENVLNFMYNFSDDISSTSSKTLYTSAIEMWNKVVDSESGEEYTFEAFLSEQMNLHIKSHRSRRYSPHLTAFAYSLYIKSTACYQELLNSNFLYLPSVRHLKRLTSCLSLSATTDSKNNAGYLQRKSQGLLPHERTVNLLIDEIHVRPSTTYKGKALYGFAENEINTEATSIQAFMISSIFCKYKEIIGLVPVKNMSASDLTTFTKTALTVLKNASFVVLAVISDNNRINRNMFRNLRVKDDDNVSIINPVDDSASLFLLFDSVHIMKALRNNLLNQSDSEKTFICPAFTNLNETVSVKFAFLRKIFNIERNSVVKYAHKLNFKTVYPASIERQNVNLALNIFDESTQAAVKIYGQQGYFHDWESTVEFLKTMKKWWNIMNIKSTKKGIVKHNDDCLPFRSVDDERLSFLEYFISWLDAWKKMKLKPRCGCLTEETFYALGQTTKGMILLVKHLLNQGNSYVLTGKFQTDCLESRFGIYRQMSGSNYHVLVSDIIESERKLRIKNILAFDSSKLGKIVFRTLYSDAAISNDVEETDISDFVDVLCDFSIDVSNDEVEVLTYIAGYCVFKLRLLCNVCQAKYVSKNNIMIETSDIDLEPISVNKCDSFINIINRGGLKKPSRMIVNVLIHRYSIFKKILTPEFEEKFQKCNLHQHTVLVNLFKFYFANCDVFSFEEKCDTCGLHMFSSICKIICTFSNICLKNYTKVLSDKCLVNLQERKLKKFKSK